MVLWPSMPGEHNAMSALVRILIPKLCSYSYCYGTIQATRYTHSGADSGISEGGGGGGGEASGIFFKKKGGGGGLTTYSWIRSNYNKQI